MGSSPLLGVTSHDQAPSTNSQTPTCSKDKCKCESNILVLTMVTHVTLTDYFN
ncbi:hypothetical protein LR48_Vigan10g056500 [Vigna angularis]|uniref:Uncharacterized protein n=1 Tax=Phaseolus angularis TaxID=3914 RepID=A0A0L9VI60_PHAAN|nr:hypothetical protein LR48_Vigan10g056500 [Vigna angularis]